MGIEFDYQNKQILIDGVVIGTFTGVPGGSVNITPYGTITATDLQTALEQLADQYFRQNETPTGPNIEEGDMWYDKDDDQLKAYRETSIGVFEWVPVILGDPTATSDIVDAGAY
jgi:hypothetical protein